MPTFYRSNTDIVRRLRTAMEAAWTRNPDLLPIYGTNGVAPTVVQNNTADGALTQILYAHNAKDRFSVTGGRLYTSGAPGFLQAAVATQNVSPGTGNIKAILEANSGVISPALVNNGEQMISYHTYQYMTDAPKFQFNISGVSGYNIRLIVDGQYLTVAGHDFSTNQWLSVDFGSRKARHIIIECHNAVQFWQIRMDARSRMWKPTPMNDVKVIVTGDSHTQGVVLGAPDYVSSYLQKSLGFGDVQTRSISAGGYVTTASSGAPAINGQMDQWIGETGVDLVVFLAGYNDPNAGSTATAAQACWAKARTAFPNAVILVGGIFGGGTGPSSNVTTLEGLLSSQHASWKAAANSGAGDKLTAFIPISTDVEPWEFGTGSTANVQATGNASLYVSGTDNIHANNIGNNVRGFRFASAARNAILKLSA